MKKLKFPPKFSIHWREAGFTMPKRKLDIPDFDLPTPRRKGRRQPPPKDSPKWS